MLMEHKFAKTSPVDAAFVKLLESAMRFGTPLVVSDAETVDPILNPVLNKEVSKAGGRNLIRVGAQDIDVSPSFRLYLTTNNSESHFSPDLCSRVTLINFTVTPEGLHAQCLSAVLKHERPDIARQRADLVMLHGEFHAQLMQCEEALLVALAESQGNMLENDTLISQLETIKKDST
jgi:dynein heavy chain 1